MRPRPPASPISAMSQCAGRRRPSRGFGALQIRGRAVSPGQRLFIIIRPGPFLETHAYQVIGQPILEKGKTTIFGRGTGRRDLSRSRSGQLILMVWITHGCGQTIEIGGPPENNLTNNEVAALFEQAAGRPAKVSHVPHGVLRIMSPLLRPLHPGMSQVMA